MRIIYHYHNASYYLASVSLIKSKFRKYDQISEILRKHTRGIFTKMFPLIGNFFVRPDAISSLYHHTGLKCCGTRQHVNFPLYTVSLLSFLFLSPLFSLPSFLPSSLKSPYTALRSDALRTSILLRVSICPKLFHLHDFCVNGCKLWLNCCG